MALQSTVITRSFKYNGLTLSDPSPSKSADQVRLFYSAHYPELTNAVVEGPVTKAGVATYTFTRAVGSKGASREPTEQILARIVAQGISLSGTPLDGATPSQIKESKKCSQVVSAIMNSKNMLTAIRPPSTAYSIFG